MAGGKHVRDSSRPAGKMIPSAALPRRRHEGDVPEPVALEEGHTNPICLMFLGTRDWAGSTDQFTTACTSCAFTLASTAVRSVAVESYTSVIAMVIPFGGASFSSWALPPWPKPVLLTTTPMRLMPSCFIVVNIACAAKLSICGVLKTHFATGLTIVAAAAHEMRICSFWSA